MTSSQGMNGVCLAGEKLKFSHSTATLSRLGDPLTAACRSEPVPRNASLVAKVCRAIATRIRMDIRYDNECRGRPASGSADCNCASQNPVSYVSDKDRACVAGVQVRNPNRCQTLSASLTTFEIGRINSFVRVCLEVFMGHHAGRFRMIDFSRRAVL